MAEANERQATRRRDDATPVVGSVDANRGSVVAPSTAFVAACEPKMTGCSAIRAQVIRHQLVRDKAIFLKKLAQKRAAHDESGSERHRNLGIGFQIK
jgi:hypothetical protein